MQVLCNIASTIRFLYDRVMQWCVDGIPPRLFFIFLAAAASLLFRSMHTSAEI